MRRLGRYEIFIENILFLGRLRRSGAFNELNFSFTYQKDNMDEMRDFVLFAEQMNGDFIIFERLQNLGAFSDEEYRERAVHHESHRLYSKFIQVISDPIFRQSKVWHDFDYPGIENMAPAQAMARAQRQDLTAARI